MSSSWQIVRPDDTLKRKAIAQWCIFGSDHPKQGKGELCMWDDDHQTARTRPNAPPETMLCADQYGGDGIARYLRTMHEVAHTPGMYHWCTPGHNRGKAFEALSASSAHILSAEATALPAIRRTLRLEKING